MIWKDAQETFSRKKKKKRVVLIIPFFWGKKKNNISLKFYMQALVWCCCSVVKSCLCDPVDCQALISSIISQEFAQIHDRWVSDAIYLSSAASFSFFLYISMHMGRRRPWHPTPVLLLGKSHGRRSLVGCSPWGHQESDTTEWLHFHFSLSCVGEGNGNPLQCSCLENPRDGEPGGLPSMGSHRVRHNWSDFTAAAAAYILEGGRDFSHSSVGKSSACSAGDLGSITGSRRSSGKGNGSPLQYSCLENSMDRGLKSRTWLSH